MPRSRSRLVAIMLSLFTTSCQSTEAMSENEKFTRYQLALLSAACDKFERNNILLSNFSSLDDFFAAAQDHYVMSKGDSAFLARDAWGTPFRWELRQQDQFVRIISCGRNRVFEAGSGDDLVLQRETPQGKWVILGGKGGVEAALKVPKDAKQDRKKGP